MYVKWLLKFCLTNMPVLLTETSGITPESDLMQESKPVSSDLLKYWHMQCSEMSRNIMIGWCEE